MPPQIKSIQEKTPVSKGFPPKLKDSPREQDLDLPRSVGRATQEELCEERWGWEHFYIPVVEVGAVLRELPLVTGQIWEVHQQTNCCNCFPPHLGKFWNSWGWAL